ncbi:MAG TPA: hypothetical protein VGC41_13830 [Kofleriaceae bacterium]
MNAAVERLKAAILALETPSWAEGTIDTKRLGIAVKGEAAPVGTKKLSAWLTDRAEPAPFGHAQKTKLDEKVRSTLRVKARGKTQITGLGLEAILEAVEDNLGLTTKLSAALLDVLVYPSGGKFLRHKDTPRTPEQVGTLNVEVPFTHKGGVMKLDDHSAKREVDWSKPAKQARWLALFGDVDHEIAKVTSGHRITLVYVLSQTKKPRTNATLAAKSDALHDAIIALAAEKPKKDDYSFPRVLHVPCTRLANAPITGKLATSMLRGSDRIIADAFIACGLETAVREVLIAQNDDVDDEKFPASFYGTATLKKPIPAKLLRSSMLSYTANPGGDYIEEDGGDIDIPSIAPYIVQNWNGSEAWIVRPAATATVVYSGLYSETGYFGNECDEGRIYKTVAIEVAVIPKKPTLAKPKKKKKK